MTHHDPLPVLYIPHGGGPCFFMDWDPPETWARMAAYLRSVGQGVPRPKAIIVISAHWEEANFTVQATPTPELIYDYYGFPPHTYALTYPAVGDPALALRVRDLLQGQGMPCAVDTQRGYDHGVFIPFKLIYPEADIPVLQLSLKNDLDPLACYRAGQALAPLRDEGVLIVGSGMSYHNLRAFFGDSPAKTQTAAAFDQWLSTAVVQPEGREAKLGAWAQAPGARTAHPREEHLLPLMVVAGAARNDAGRCTFTDTVMGAAISAYQFG